MRGARNPRLQACRLFGRAHAPHQRRHARGDVRVPRTRRVQREAAVLHAVAVAVAPCKRRSSGARHPLTARGTSARPTRAARHAALPHKRREATHPPCRARAAACRPARMATAVPRRAAPRRRALPQRAAWLKRVTRGTLCGQHPVGSHGGRTGCGSGLVPSKSRALRERTRGRADTRQGRAADAGTRQGRAAPGWITPKARRSKPACCRRRPGPQASRLRQPRARCSPPAPRPSAASPARCATANLREI